MTGINIIKVHIPTSNMYTYNILVVYSSGSQTFRITESLRNSYSVLWNPNVFNFNSTPFFLKKTQHYKKCFNDI